MTAAIPQRIARPKRKGHLRVVDAQRLGKIRRGKRLVRAAGIFTAMFVLSIVAFHVWLAQGQFDLDRLETEAQNKQAAYEDLAVDVAQSSSPNAVTSAAEEMGMIQPTEVTQIVIDPNMMEPKTNQDSAEDGWEKVKSSLATHPE